VVPLCAGIISRIFFDAGNWLLIAIAGIAVILFIVSILSVRAEHNYVFGISFAVFLFIAGHIMYDSEKDNISLLEEKETTFLCTLQQFPEEKDRSFKIIADLKGRLADDNMDPVKGSLLLYSSKSVSWDDYIPGDLFVIRCKPEKISDRGNPCGFNYCFYMERGGIRYYSLISADDILLHRAPPSRSLLQRALVLRRRIIRMYEERGIKGEMLATVAAVTLGEKRMLEPEQKQSFITAGVMHIMAVSGLHAVIISIIVMNILSFLKNRMNWLRIALAILVLWTFAFTTGLTPSVLRATIMFTFLQAGWLLKRPVNPVNSVLASAFVLMLVKPSVIFEAGFLLSYSAVVFIICFYHDLHKRFAPANYFANKTWQLAAVSLVAQAGTLPLTISMFNRFPTYFLVANIIIVPLSSLMILLGCLVPLTYPLVPVSEFFALLLKVITVFTVDLTNWVASLPMASVVNIGMTTGACISLSIVLFLTFNSVLNPGPLAHKLLLTSLFGFTVYSTLVDIRTRVTSELIVYSLADGSCVGLRTGKALYLYHDTGSPPLEVQKHCSTLGLVPGFKRMGDRPVILKARGTEVLIAPSAESIEQALNVYDIVVMTGPCSKRDLAKFPKNHDSELVITSDVTEPEAAEIKTLLHGKVHFTNLSGAFITPFGSRTK
jgi:competence protein ComEC